MSNEKLGTVTINAPYLRASVRALTGMAGDEVLSYRDLSDVGLEAVAQVLIPGFEPPKFSMRMGCEEHFKVEDGGWKEENGNDLARVELNPRNELAERALASTFSIAIIASVQVTTGQLRILITQKSN